MSVPLLALEPQRFPLRRRELVLIGAFWLTYATLSIASRIFDRGGNFSALSGVATIALVEALCWMVLTPPIFLIASRLESVRSRGMQVVLVVLAGFLIAFLMGAFGSELRRIATPFGPGGPRVSDTLTTIVRRRMRPPSGPPIWFGMLNALVLYVGVFAAGLARTYSRRYQLRREEAARNEARLEAQLAEARLDALRRQLDPHFLFNTLNAVSALLERDPRGVRRMISRLSELLRHSFEGSGDAEVSLRDELAWLTRYVEIMQVRFQGRLTVESHVDDGALDAMVPSMVLQPIVENAIKHGVEKSTQPGIISIVCSVAGDSLVIRVSDNGPGIAAQTRDGVGVRNTVARLAELYRDRASFSLSTGESGGAVAELRVPFHTSARVT